MYTTWFDYVLIVILIPCVIAIFLLLTSGGALFPKRPSAQEPLPKSPSSPRKRPRRSRRGFKPEAADDEEDDAVVQSPMVAERLQLKQPRWESIASEYKFKGESDKHLTEEEWKEKENQVDRDLLKGFVALGFKTKQQAEQQQKVKEAEAKIKEQEREEQARKRAEAEKRRRALAKKQGGAAEKKKPDEDDDDEKAEKKPKKLWEQSLEDMGIHHDVKELDGRGKRQQQTAVVEDSKADEGEQEAAVEEDDKGKGGKKKVEVPISPAGIDYLTKFNKEKAAADKARHSTFSKGAINLATSPIIGVSPKAAKGKKGKQAEEEEETDAQDSTAKKKNKAAPWKGFTPEVLNTKEDPKYPRLPGSSPTRSPSPPSSPAKNETTDEETTADEQTSPREGGSGTPSVTRAPRPVPESVQAVVDQYIKDPESINRPLTPAEWRAYQSQVRAKKNARAAKLKDEREKRAAQRREFATEATKATEGASPEDDPQE